VHFLSIVSGERKVMGGAAERQAKNDWLQRFPWFFYFLLFSAS
jgi:hypothetical protein